MARCALIKVNTSLGVHLSRWLDRKVGHLPRGTSRWRGSITEATGALSRSLQWSAHLSCYFEYWQLMEHSCLHLGALALVMEPPTLPLRGHSSAKD